MRKTDFFLCENKGTDQLCSNCEADHRLCFCYTDSTVPLLPYTEFQDYHSSVTVQAGLCRTWSEIPKTGFLVLRLSWAYKQKPCQTARSTFFVLAYVRVEFL